MRKVLGALVVAFLLFSSAAAAQLVNSFFFIPVVTKAPGVQGTFWQSEVSVTNLGTSTAKVGWKFFPADVANTFNSSQFLSQVQIPNVSPQPLIIPPGQTFVLPNVLNEYLYYVPIPGATKGFMIVADITPVNCNVATPPTAFPGLLAVTSRTYNIGDPKGIYSTAAEMNLAAMNFTTYPSVMPGVRHTGTTPPGFRTNLSVVNISTTRIKLLVKIFKADGSLAVAEIPQTVEALSFKQWSLWPNFNVPTLGDGPGRIEVRLDPTQVANPCTSVTDTFCTNPCDPQKCPTKYAMRSQPTFFAYASMTDNGTGDGTILSSFVDWQGYSKWVSDYEKQHCPSITIYRSNMFTDWLRQRGFFEPEPPPMLRKVGTR